jgi:hypothetical protein
MIRFCYKDAFSPLPEDWIHLASVENDFDPCFGHYGSIARAIENHRVIIRDATGAEREVVNLTAALKSGEKKDVVGLRRK